MIKDTTLRIQTLAIMAAILSIGEEGDCTEIDDTYSTKIVRAAGRILEAAEDIHEIEDAEATR